MKSAEIFSLIDVFASHGLQYQSVTSEMQHQMASSSAEARLAGRTKDRSMESADLLSVGYMCVYPQLLTQSLCQV